MQKQVDHKQAQKTCFDYYERIHKQYLNDHRDELEKKTYDQEFLTRFIAKLPKNPHILDIGCCSTAQQARHFRDKGFKVTSIDLSAKCIETAKKNFHGIDFFQMDMLEITFEDNTFEAINASYSIIHIPDEKLDGLFYDFNRLLKSNGKIAISVHAGDFYGYYDVDGTDVFFRTFTQEELKTLLKNHGFKLLEIDQRQPIYNFEFQSERIYLIAEKIN